MADPYAPREGIAVGEQSADVDPARELVGRLGGFCALELADLKQLGLGSAVGGGATDAGTGGGVARADAADATAVDADVAEQAISAVAARFVGVVVRDEGLLPPIAAIEPAFGALLLTRGAEGCAAANDGLAALDGAASGGLPIYLLKQGLVAGPAGREGAYAVNAELIERLVGAALAGEIEWEADPDFGYRVAARVPGLEGSDAEALCPRLLYAAADRVYEHAEAVATLKAERRRRVEAVPGIDERVLEATRLARDADRDRVEGLTAAPTATTIVVERRSELAVPAERAWRWATTPEGINAEFRPLLRMTMPARVARRSASTSSRSAPRPAAAGSCSSA